MGLLDDVIGSAVPGGNLSKPLIIALFALLASGALYKRSTPEAPAADKPVTPPKDADEGVLGGLGGLLRQFQKTGHDDVIDTWIGPGQNRPMSPGQLGSALGPNVVKSLAQKTGLSEQDLLAQLSQILPDVVDKLTPSGRLPTPREVAKGREGVGA
jgi:uncharacterized protein YidB (DUF937 family)